MVLVIALFASSWRAAFITIVSIPLSLAAAYLVLDLRSAPINLMALAGLVIALGFVVDDVIVDVENIVRRLRRHRTEGGAQSTASVVLDASLEVRGAIVYATLIIVLAAVPMFLIEGQTGSFFQPLVISYVLAVAASMVVSLTVTPALSLILFAKAPPEGDDSRLVRWLARGSDRVLSILVIEPRIAIASGVSALLIGVVVSVLFAQSMLDGDVTVPPLQETDLLIEVDSVPGTSVPEMVRVLTLVQGDLQAIPGVNSVAATIGRAVTGDQVVGTNASQLWVSIDPEVDYDEIVSAIEGTVDSYPGLDGQLRPYLSGTTSEVLGAASEAITVRVYGPGLDVLRDKAEEVRQVISGVDGIVDLRVDGVAAAKVWISTGRESAAFDACEAASQLAPEHWEANYLYGLLLTSGGRPQDALAPLQRSLASNPLFVLTHVVTGNVFMLLGAPEDAADSFLAAIDLEADNPGYWLNLAAAYGQLGQTNLQRRAEAEYQRLVDEQTQTRER